MTLTVGKEEKRCIQCRLYKPLNSFWKDRSRVDGIDHRCKECGLINGRKHYITKSEWAKNHKEVHVKAVREYESRNPEKKKAWGILNKEIKNGKIVKQPCIVCANKIVQGHHEDYNKPLEVVWLCSTHHKDVHYGRIVL